jgi:uncharacterized membrane protein YkoI
MKNRKINQHLYKALQEAPIDLLVKLKSQPINKLEKHDCITMQETPSKRKDRWKPVIALGTCAAVFMMVLFGWLLQYSSVDSIVYFDVNPSIEIVTDKNERVVRLQTLIQDDQALVEGIDYKGKDLYVVTQELLDVLMIEGYIDDLHRIMLISVMNNNLERGRVQTMNLNTTIHDYFEEYNIKPIVLRQSITDSGTIEEYADKYNISIGKMTFIRNLIILNPDFKVEELVVLSLKDLVFLSAQTRLDIKSIIDADADLDDFYRDEGQEKEQENGVEDDALIGRENVIETALALTGGGEVVGLELDQDDGRYKYEIKIIKDGKEYEIEIDAYTGEALVFEVDDDD